MNSSYSSLDCVLSHWAHFTVQRLIYLCLSVVFVFFCFILRSCCIIVSVLGWTWWDWSLIFRTYLSSVLWHCWLGHLTRKNPSPVWPNNVFVGTLNFAQWVNKNVAVVVKGTWKDPRNTSVVLVWIFLSSVVGEVFAKLFSRGEQVVAIV